MIKYIKSLFAWNLVFASGTYRYYENTVTGRRRAVKAYNGHSPINNDWLNRTNSPSTPPTGGSGVVK
jgi:hypothetical protein